MSERSKKFFPAFFHFLMPSAFCLLLIVSCLPEAHAMTVTKNPIHKLGRGLVYIVASPFQFPKEMIQVTAEEEVTWIAPWKGMSAGIGSGFYHAGRQGMVGIWDIATFFTPAGRDWQPLLDTSLVPEV